MLKVAGASGTVASGGVDDTNESVMDRAIDDKFIPIDDSCHHITNECKK